MQRYCPECGSEEFKEVDKSFRVCKSCGQDYYTHVDYDGIIRTKLVRSHKFATAVQSYFRNPNENSKKAVLEWLDKAYNKKV